MGNANCTIVGQKYNSGSYGTTNSCYAGGSDYNAYCLKFNTPEFVGVFESLSISLKANNSSYDTGMLRYAICTSDTNLSMYRAAENSDVTGDPYQIASGVAAFTGLKSASVNTFSINSVTQPLMPNTVYYLIMWVYKADGIPGIQFTVHPIANHTVTIVVNDGLIYIDTGSSIRACQMYVDNGTGWELCVPYIDTGKEWKQCV